MNSCEELKMCIALTLTYLSTCTYLGFFFFNDTATTEIYTLSLHDALPICAGARARSRAVRRARARRDQRPGGAAGHRGRGRSEEHTSELQSRQYLVCRLLLEKKKTLHNEPR